MSGNVTIKGGTGFDVPWLVIEAPADGSASSKVEAQRAYILAAFGMDPEDPEIKDLSLAEVVVQASVHFQGVWSAAQGLGAKGVRADVGEAPKAAKGASRPRVTASKIQVTNSAKVPEAEPVPASMLEVTQVDTEPEAPAAEEEHPHQDVLDEIAAAESKKELMSIYHGNKAAMTDNSVLDALKARTKAVAA